MPDRDTMLSYDDQLNDESNAALEKGGRVAFLLSAVAVVAILLSMASGLAEGLWAPCGLAVSVAVYCLILYRLAKRRLLRGAMAWIVTIVSTCLPTGFFVATHILLPAGAATFLNGPAILLYFILIITSGFLFDYRLPLVASVVAALGYVFVSALSLPQLGAIEVSDPLLRQNLASPAIHVFKALTMIFAGITVASLAVVGRRLILRAVAEEREKQMLHRLFGQYVSEEVREKLLHGRGVRKGERREVVVLFSDIRGFTTVCESAPPEEIVSRLNDYFDAMVEAITSNGGVVDKFIGDAVMAVFGGVIELDDPGQAAVQAALDMREKVKPLNDRWAAAGLRPFENGIGLHLGEVIQGPIGAEHRKDFTVIGDAVNIAARLEGLTRKTNETILVSEALFERLSERVQRTCEPLGSFQLKGRSHPVQVWGVST